MSTTDNVPLTWISSMKNFYFWKLQFLKHLKHFLLKFCPFFVSWFWSFGKKYENDIRVIFDQWPKLSLGLNVRPEIPILKVIYYLPTTTYLQVWSSRPACIRGCQLDNTGSQPFPKWPQFCKFDMPICIEKTQASYSDLCQCHIGKFEPCPLLEVFLSNAF